MWREGGDENCIIVEIFAKLDLGRETTIATWPNLRRVKNARLLLLLPMRRIRYEMLFSCACNLLTPG